ncbi:pilus assembly FimT family protein [Sulfurovum riftiae]|uniref:N-terminal methylation n=1 Tax=Sulfurovum riftiae TaxID=1630136 RepID=A0A151CFJ6_9BACT|nr:type II secretion system protein [Sulfurovum riftiae]KYJ86286.1 hypothetical protein AS592_05680 [Sulfurovum riftiae]
MKKPAFTMIELTLVIVVIGILAALALPRLDRDLRQGAKDNILAAIRYTQHLALVDDKTDPRDANWQQELWTIRFSADGDGRYFYTISSNADHGGNVDKNETAIDPINGKYIYNAAGDSTIDNDESPNLFLGKKYGVDSVAFGGGCSGSTHIAFDHLGRPFKSGIFSASNPYDGYMTTDCTITVGFEDTSITNIVFTIEKETGYVSAI